jgi:hypothetical protein
MSGRLPLLLSNDEVDLVTLTFIKSVKGEVIASHLSDIIRAPDDADNADNFAVLQNDLRKINTIATTLERAIMEMSNRRGYHDLKSEGKIQKGMWTAVAGAGSHILAVSKDHTEVVKKATATGNHFIVRWMNFDD